MALKQVALQKKRTKRSQHRKEIQKKATGALDQSRPFAREWSAAVNAPVGDVLVPGSLFDIGIGSIWFSRLLADGRYAVSVFLIDVYCLGVKNALYAVVEPDDYARRLKKLLETYPDYRPEHPTYARKLVEEAAAFASDLGFEPHPDYKMARIIFSEVEAAACPVTFSFGEGGKPFYVSGPNDTPKLQTRILQQLEKRCGAGGFNFLLSGGPGW